MVWERASWVLTHQKMPRFSTPEEAHTHFQAPTSTGPCSCPWGPYRRVIVIALFLLLRQITADRVDNDGDRRISYPGGRSEGDYPQHSRRYKVIPPSLPLSSLTKLTPLSPHVLPLILRLLSGCRPGPESTKVPSMSGAIVISGRSHPTIPGLASSPSSLNTIKEGRLEVMPPDAC